MKRAIIGLFIASLSSAAAAQQRPLAQMRISPSTMPEVLQVLDSTKTWVTIGTVDPTTHIFASVGGGGRGGGAQAWPLLVTDPSVGMRAGRFDNSIKVAALMNAIGPGPGTFAGGYDVVIPGISGQRWTTYYFSKSFELSRNAHYHCASSSSPGVFPSIQLVFPAGVDEIIQADTSTSADGGQGAGEISGCGITSLGRGEAISGGGANTITSVGQFGDPAGVVPVTPWAVGDGILVTPTRAGFHPSADEPLAAHGAFVSSVTPAGTLTLASGFSIASNFLLSTQYFLQNGWNNFLATEQMLVGNNTFTFVTGTPGTGQIKIGANFSATAHNLASAITTNAADPLGQWGKPTNTPNVKAVARTDPVFAVGSISFSALTGAATGDATLASYTRSETAAGSFDAYFVEPGPLTSNFVNNETMVVGNTTLRFRTSGTLSAAGDVQILAGDVDHTSYNIIAAVNGGCNGTNCIAPSPAPNVRASSFPPSQVTGGWYIRFYSIAGGGPTTYTGAAGAFGATTFSATGTTFKGGQTIDNVEIWQLPATQKFTGVTATVGSSSISVGGGPRPLREGDWIWSKDFPYGATVGGVNGKTFPQTVGISNAFMAGGLNATANDSGGQLWVIPDALKRETIAQASNNTFSNFPIGLQMGCINFVCTGSVDTANLYSGAMLGRVVQGHNTAGSTSFGEITHVTTLADVMEGGTLGSNYFGFNANTNDNGNWSVIGNCVNQNYSVFYGGYMGSIQPYCADPNNGIFPTSNSGNMPIFIGASGGVWPIGAPGIVTGIGNNMQINGGMVFSQNGTSLCLTGGGAYLFGFSSDNACGSPSTWYTRWNTAISAFDLDHWVGSNEFVMRYAATNNGYPGYAGPTGTGVIFPYGIVVNNVEDAGNETTDARLICLSKVLPTNANHKKGDICFNSDPTHGGPVGWTDMADGANFEAWGTLP